MLGMSPLVNFPTVAFRALFPLKRRKLLDMSSPRHLTRPLSDPDVLPSTEWSALDLFSSCILLRFRRLFVSSIHFPRHYIGRPRVLRSLSRLLPLLSCVACLPGVCQACRRLRSCSLTLLLTPRHARGRACIIAPFPFKS